MFTKRSDALAAMKRYNNVQLDGKPMKIEVIGSNLGMPVSARVNVVGRGTERGRRTVVMTYVKIVLSTHSYYCFSSISSLIFFLISLPCSDKWCC